MSKKFYAVTTGEYSDYHIITITDDEQRANNIAKIYDAEVKEYTDDISENAQVTYMVWMFHGTICQRSLLTDVKKNEVVIDAIPYYPLDEMKFDARVYVDASSSEEAKEKAEPLFLDFGKRKGIIE